MCNHLIPSSKGRVEPTFGNFVSYTLINHIFIMYVTLPFWGDYHLILALFVGYRFLLVSNFGICFCNK